MPDDPERMADASSRSPLGQLFASAARDLPSDEQLRQLADKLDPVLGGPPGASPAAPRSSVLAKLGVITGALALLIGAALSLHRSSHPAPVARPPNATAMAVDTSAPTPPAPPAAPVAEPASAPVAPSRALDDAGAPDAKPSPTPSKAPNEAALLEQARRALNNSPVYALQLANQHRARFPNGVLTQEREVIAIEALRRLHRTTEADQRAGFFSKAFPGSAHQRMVDEAAPKR